MICGRSELLMVQDYQNMTLKHIKENTPSLYWYFLSMTVGSEGFGWMFSASSLSSLSSQVRSDSSGGGEAAAGGWVSCGGAGAGSGGATTCSWVKEDRRVSRHLKGGNGWVQAQRHTSLKASRRSPTASFLFKSLIFLFFFGTDTAAAWRHSWPQIRIHVSSTIILSWERLEITVLYKKCVSQILDTDIYIR